MGFSSSISFLSTLHRRFARINLFRAATWHFHDLRWQPGYSEVWKFCYVFVFILPSLLTSNLKNPVKMKEFNKRVEKDNLLAMWARLESHYLHTHWEINFQNLLHARCITVITPRVTEVELLDHEHLLDQQNFDSVRLTLYVLPSLFLQQHHWMMRST